MINVKKTDKLIFDLKMHQVDRNEEKKEALRKEISEKYGVPVENVEVNFVSITVDENGKRVSLAADIVDNIQNPAFQQSLFPQYLSLKGITDVNMEVAQAEPDNTPVLQEADYISNDPLEWYKKNNPEDPYSALGIRMVMALAKDVVYVPSMDLNNLMIEL